MLKFKIYEYICNLQFNTFFEIYYNKLIFKSFQPLFSNENGLIQEAGYYGEKERK